MCVSVCESQVLHLAHISKSGTHRLTLVNPLAVDLEDYKSRLSRSLQAFERCVRLNSNDIGSLMYLISPEEPALGVNQYACSQSLSYAIVSQNAD